MRVYKIRLVSCGENRVKPCLVYKNKLSLHLGKTASILFGTKRKLSNCGNLNVSCNGINIESTCKTSVKYLGASIDN